MVRQAVAASRRASQEDREAAAARGGGGGGGLGLVGRRPGSSPGGPFPARKGLGPPAGSRIPSPEVTRQLGATTMNALLLPSPLPAAAQRLSMGNQADGGGGGFSGFASPAVGGSRRPSPAQSRRGSFFGSKGSPGQLGKKGLAKVVPQRETTAFKNVTGHIGREQTRSAAAAAAAAQEKAAEAGTVQVEGTGAGMDPEEAEVVARYLGHSVTAPSLRTLGLNKDGAQGKVSIRNTRIERQRHRKLAQRQAAGHRDRFKEVLTEVVGGVHGGKKL